MNDAARRRGGLALAAAGALALVLLAVVLAGGDDPDVSLTVAGPPPSSDGTGAGQVAPFAPPALPAEPATTTTTPDQLPVQNTPPLPPRTTVPPADDPVVRSPTTLPSGNASRPVPSDPPAPAPLPTVPSGSACPVSGVRVSVVTGPAYGRGQTVQGSTVIENRSGTTCLLPTRGFVRILSAAGKDVSRFAYTMEYRFPVSAEPGKTFTTPFTWDQRDCSGATCVQVPAGTYTVHADWTEGGSYSGQGSFQVNA